jgi:subtilisin family serine protease
MNSNHRGSSFDMAILDPSVGLEMELVDVPGNSTSAETLAHGQSIAGDIEILGDSDWFAVNLVAGRTYVFEMLGTETSQGTQADPFLTLYSAASVSLASDDDNGKGTNSRLTFTATVSGRHYLAASSWNNVAVGTYTLTMRQETISTPDPAGIASATVPTDPEFASQWHLQSTAAGINVLPAWRDYTGSGVRVGVFDSGVDVGNSDLDDRVDLTRSIVASSRTTGGRPLRTEDNHGTAVSGTIAAERNGRGTVGVAYNATIVMLYDPLAGSVRSLGSSLTNAYTVAATSLDVINNSWGFGNNFANSPDSAFIDNLASSDLSATARQIRTAIVTGRSGLGVVIVQAAGNSRAFGDDTNLHSFQNNRYTITVGATTASGGITGFSTPGASVLLTAPGQSILTTDRSGADGYNGGDTVVISGTSFSSPIVAGVAALMLQANPRLGYRDVQEILALSTKMTATGTAGWAGTAATGWNGGGMRYSHDYGFGLVDAHAAVRLAESWTAQSTAANETTLTAAAAGSLAIADGSEEFVQTTLQISGSQRIDRVEVDLAITHPNIGDLTVELVSPGGTTAILLNRPGRTATAGGGSSQDNVSFTFGAAGFLGEAAAGTWTLRLKDSKAADVGTLTGWTLRTYGDANSADTTQVFTDDFATLVVADGTRRQIGDSDGGTDSINAAAVSSGSVIDLSGGTSRIVGTELTIAANVFERAVGGDGNDLLIAGSNGATLIGGHGSDTLRGGAGFDTVQLNGRMSDYSIAQPATGIITLVSGGVTDTVSSVERLVFSDRAIIASAPAWQNRSDSISLTASGASFTVRQESIVALTDPVRGSLTSQVTVNGTAVTGVPSTLKAGWRVAGSADIDGNGRQEIFFYGLDQVSGAGATWEFDSSGKVVRTQQQLQLRIAGWEAVGAADLNSRIGDEILWQNTLTGAKAIWSDTNRDGVLDLGVVISGLGTDTSQRIVGTAVLQLGGRQDLVMFNDRTGRMTVFSLTDSGTGALSTSGSTEFASFTALQTTISGQTGSFRLFNLPPLGF